MITVRIAVFTDYRYARAGGAIWAERAFAVFLNELARHHELTVIGREGTSDDGVAPRYRLATGVRFCGLPFYESLTRAGSGLRTLPRAVRRFNRASADADVVWILGPNPVAQAFVLAALARRVPVVLGVRQDLPAVVAARYPGRSVFLAAATAMEVAWRLSARQCPCVVVGPQIAEAYRASPRLHVLTVSLMRARDITSGPAARSESGRELLSVGRLEPEKDPLLLADVLAFLHEDGEPWRLRVCGEGPLRDVLETRLRRLGLSGAVSFDGYVRHGAELLERYRHADALVITSRSEGLPQTVMEAFAVGLPVVSSDVGGIRAAFGAAAATVPRGDARAAAACLRRLCGHPAARQQMADAGRSVARNHTLEAEAERLGEFLADSTRRCRRSAPSALRPDRGDAMIHVAFLKDILPVTGGAERLLMQTLLSLDRSRFERTLILTRWDPVLAHSEAGVGVLTALENAGVRVLGVRRTSRLSPHAWVLIIRWLRTHRVDVLHAHKFGANLAGAMIGRLTGVPVIAHEHGLRASASRARRLADRRLIGRLAAVVLCVSEADRERLVTTERLPPRKVRHVPLGIPAPDGRPPSRAEVRRALGLPAEGVVIVSTAVLRPEKRLDVLLAAFAEVCSTAPGAVLLVMGDGPQRASLEAQAATLALGRRVRFLGHRTDVPRVLAAADIGVLCSDHEGTPLALLEYMDAGLAVAVTEVGGIPAMVRHERDGLLVPPGSPIELGAGLRRLCADPPLREALGKSARARCRREFDLGPFVRTLEALYREIATS